eukprot:CAMPEP_0195292734 /NCGR_PEP_ID=MMETSP0707-20130614/10747_1 /TAXON_ID=33640 /ORGANISM="Asterionellopsis glacialis, Strain CCMP134" /LENGTH=1451 /DNA_ID=CAMNT_0040353279 /DNA_START=120 /DNA_END=4475 /DNA_ORIENTATION=+
MKVAFRKRKRGQQLSFEEATPSEVVQVHGISADGENDCYYPWKTNSQQDQQCQSPQNEFNKKSFYHRGRIRKKSDNNFLFSILFVFLATIVICAGDIQLQNDGQPTIPTPSSSSSLIICAVDGSVLTLDAFSGDLRGLFSSGSPLIGASDAIPSVADHDGDHADPNEESNGDRTATPPPRARIVPGLDGRLYALRNIPQEDAENNNVPQMEPMPITVMDILANPVRTCFSENECGIVTGTKSTSLFALDPTTGILQWVQSSDADRPTFVKEDEDNFQGDNGDDTNGNKSVHHENVLLQREDFVVKQISANTGKEVWNVTVGHFVALDFDNPSSSTPSHQQGPLKRYSDKGLNDAMLLPGYAEQQERLLWEEDDESSSTDHDEFLLPSVAFSEDGTVITAVDKGTGAVLWKKDLEFSIASVYGVAEDHSGWIPLKVLDEHNLMQEADAEKITFTSMLGLAPPPNGPQEDREAYLEFLMSGGMNQDLYPDLQMDGANHGNAVTVYKPPNAKEILEDTARFSQVRDTIDRVRGNPNVWKETCTPLNRFCGGTPQIAAPSSPSAQTYGEEKTSLPSIESPPSSSPVNGGLFLTWSMVFWLVLFLLSVAVAVRIKYVKSKEKWALQYGTLPSQDPSTQDEGGDRSHRISKSSTVEFALGGDVALPLHNSTHTSTEVSSSENISKTSLKRSMSLPMFNADSNSDELSNPKTTLSDPTQREPSPPTVPPLTSISPLKTTTTATTAHTTSDQEGITSDQAGGEEEANSSPSKNEVDLYQSLIANAGSIDGIPLVRYSRYKSEFNEFSPLGKGGFGTVFQCENAFDGREYAVKKVYIKSRIDSTGNLTKEFSQRLQRVLREVKILALLDHQNVVRYYTAWLEFEKDGPDTNGSHDEHSSAVDYMTTTTKNHAIKGFSSELLANGVGGGTSTSEAKFWNESSSTFNDNQIGKSRVSSPARSQKTTLQQPNPLGWNNFDFFPDGNTFDSARRGNTSFSSLKDEDCGISFERSISGGNLRRNSSSSLKEEAEINTNERGGSTISIDLAGMKKLKSGLPVIQDNDSYDFDDDSSSSSSDSSSSSSDDGSTSSFSTEDGDDQEMESFHPTDVAENVESTYPEADQSTTAPDDTAEVMHTLYIQMQLCSQKTLSDFLSNADARRGKLKITDNDDYAIDIPLALGLFNQIAQGVEHVHKQGLIHRDLKPQNCFIDDSGVVKVGDFGLSRESAAGAADRAEALLDESMHSRISHTDNNDITAGVGTRSYASPEQINGSDYDASTDVYSLGIMLFELCYPMYTGMERHIVFEGIRRRAFPKSWNDNVAMSFPSLHSLLESMLSPKPAERPSAASVAQHISSLLGEYTVLSLDRSKAHIEGTVFLRVEAKAVEGVLPRAIKLIKEAAPGVNIAEYGLRGQESKSILEFALSSEESPSAESDWSRSLQDIMEKMEESEDINLVRQVSAIHK